MTMIKATFPNKNRLILEYNGVTYHCIKRPPNETDGSNPTQAIYVSTDITPENEWIKVVLHQNKPWEGILSILRYKPKYTPKSNKLRIYYQLAVQVLVDINDNNRLYGNSSNRFTKQQNNPNSKNN